jgi:hypothetical protein
MCPVRTVTYVSGRSNIQSAPLQPYCNLLREVGAESASVRECAAFALDCHRTAAYTQARTCLAPVSTTDDITSTATVRNHRRTLWASQWVFCCQL